jgi:AraC family transcriptional regulator of adaptative response / DNA-3-methyladenine glycosylase II
MRALGDPDAFLPGDLGVRHALARCGADVTRAERWRPWRAYAVGHLWASLADAPSALAA